MLFREKHYNGSGKCLAVPPADYTCFGANFRKMFVFARGATPVFCQDVPKKRFILQAVRDFSVHVVNGTQRAIHWSCLAFSSSSLFVMPRSQRNIEFF